MVRVRVRGEQVRRFILENINKHPNDISRITSDRFDITRQAVNKHLHRLVSEGCLKNQGNTRNRAYKLASLVESRNDYDLNDPDLAEDVIWAKDVRPALGSLPENVLDIWQYGFTEIVNNALDHSDGSQICVRISKTAIDTMIVLSDNGVGIFKKVQTALGLIDERHAILELSKGKLTTDPDHHTGEGLFFTSRMFDWFDILSGGVSFTHQFGEDEDWIVERSSFASGTTVFLKLNNHTARTTKKIFDQYASPEGDYSFNKTVVPVRLAQYGNDKLVSRSQAKRLLSRVELFKIVMFNFDGVESVGQAFTDEIFRVFSLSHPEISLIPYNTNQAVQQMIARVQSASNGSPP